MPWGRGPLHCRQQTSTHRPPRPEFPKPSSVLGDPGMDCRAGVLARPLLPSGGDEAHLPRLAGWGGGEGLTTNPCTQAGPPDWGTAWF